MNPQIIVLFVTLATLILFVRGRLRYDFVALLGLLLLVFTGVIKPEDSFMGFSHPAVITVASVLIISNALVKTGAVDRLIALIDRGSDKLPRKIFSLMAITALLSAFMNNVGALALLLPTGLGLAKEKNISPSQLLMPIAFASLLGGMITGIGTPPNIIISAYRVQAGGEAFPFFSFAPVGLSLALVGILFTALLGWKLIPIRDSERLRERFNLEDYLFEIAVTNNCSSQGIKLKDFYETYGTNINVVSIVRDDYRIASPGGSRKIYPGDILIIKSAHSNLNDLISKTCFDLKGAKTEKLASEKLLKSDDIDLVEVVLRNDSPLIGKTAVEIKMRNKYNANLLAVSRKGISNIDRLKMFKFQSGDILLLQVPRASLNYVYAKMRCLPLAERGLDLNIEGTGKKQLITLGIFLISILLSVFNLLPVQISFATAALALVLFNVLTPREIYEAIEWPTIIMIGSLFALGHALETSGGSHTLAGILIRLSHSFPPFVLLTALMAITIILTNTINNNAATILMAPIALSLASSMGVSPDPLLMAICIGASTSFLTPIGHQSNTLIMGPGGYKFTDYWRLGLPLALVSIFLGVPLILAIWPL